MQVHIRYRYRYRAIMVCTERVSLALCSYLGNAGSVERAEERVGVGRVADDDNLAGLLGELVDGLALHLEDLHVEGQQVLPDVHRPG